MYKRQDEVIMPRDTRYKLVQALEMAHNKNQSNPPKKHGNMPVSYTHLDVYKRQVYLNPVYDVNG